MSDAHATEGIHVSAERRRSGSMGSQHSEDAAALAADTPNAETHGYETYPTEHEQEPEPKPHHGHDAAHAAHHAHDSRSGSKGAKANSAHRDPESHSGSKGAEKNSAHHAHDSRSGSKGAEKNSAHHAHDSRSGSKGAEKNSAHHAHDSRSGSKSAEAHSALHDHDSRSGSKGAEAYSIPTDPQSPAEYAAAMEGMRKERKRIAENDENLEERLQLYSEVIGLRKELEVVKTDEKRLRHQLVATKEAIAGSDRHIAETVTIYEDEAQESTLQKIWKEESVHHDPDTMEWADIDVKHLRERLEEAHKKFTAAAAKAETLHRQQEEAINETTDAREREKAAIAENHEREMESLGEACAHARQVASEQHFHRHRGTAKDRPAVVPKEKERATRQRRVDEMEFRTTAQVAAMKNELAELMEEVRQMKRVLDSSREQTEQKRREYETAIKVVEEEGAEAREMKEKLAKEEVELKELKADLQGVLHYVRAKKREEEGW